MESTGDGNCPQDSSFREQLSKVSINSNFPTNFPKKILCKISTQARTPIERQSAARRLAACRGEDAPCLVCFKLSQDWHCYLRRFLALWSREQSPPSIFAMLLLFPCLTKPRTVARRS